MKARPRRGPHRRLCPLRQYGGDAPVSAEHAQRFPRPKAESRWPGRASSAEARALFPPMGRGAAARGRISHKLFYFTERPHGGTAKRAAQAPQPGNKDVRHAQAAGLAARRHNAPGKHPPERERTPPGQTHRGMAKRPAAGQSAALRPTLRQTVWQRRKTRRLHPFLLKEAPPSASACRLRAGAPAPHLPPRMAAQALPGTLRPHRFQSRKSII